MKAKAILIIILSYLIVGVDCFADDDKNKQTAETLDVLLRTHLKKTARSLIPSVQACYYLNLGMIELEAIDMGDVDVYIVDASGNVVAEDSFNSDFMTTTTIDTPEISGTYWLIIDSSAIYAEGTFIIQ